MQIVRQLDEQSWRTFVDNHPQSQIFHTPEMFEVFARASGHRPTVWATVDMDGQVLALLLPVQLTLINGPLRYFTSRAVVYGGPLWALRSDGEEALAMLLKVFNRKARASLLFTELRNQSDTSRVQPILQANGFSYEGHLNYRVDLRLSVEGVWQNIHESARRNIRKALGKHQLRIEEVHNRDQLAICYAILQKTYDKANVPLADRSLFESAFDVLYPRGMFKSLLGLVGDTCVAASVALIYKNEIYGWYRGFDRAYSAYLPNDLLVWHILKWGAENNYCTFDFGGAGKPEANYGPREFKAKFGGALVNYGRNVCVHNRLGFQASKQIYNWGRKVLALKRRPHPQKTLAQPAVREAAASSTPGDE